MDIIPSSRFFGSKRFSFNFTIHLILLVLVLVHLSLILQVIPANFQVSSYSSSIQSIDSETKTQKPLTYATLTIKNTTIHKTKFPTLDEDYHGWNRKSCTPVYFLGGGKSGSTTLARLLKHAPPDFTEHDFYGQFASSGKEVCWAAKGVKKSEHYWAKFKGCDTPTSFPTTGLPSTHTKLFALDACPRYYSSAHASKIASVHPHAKFIMLVRDPVTRSISHFNDLSIRFKKTNNITKRVFSMARDPDKEPFVYDLSNYSEILKMFLQYFNKEQILLVRSETLTEQYQEIVDDIMDFVGGERFSVEGGGQIQGNVNRNDKKYNDASEASKCELWKRFKGVRRSLSGMVGYGFEEWEGYDCGEDVGESVV